MTRQVSRFGRVPAASIDWRTTAGPYFGNYLAMLRFDGRIATFGLEKSAFDGPVTRATPVDRDAARPDHRAAGQRVSRR